MIVRTLTNSDLEDELTRAGRLTIAALNGMGYLPEGTLEDLGPRLLITLKDPSFFDIFWNKFFRTKDSNTVRMFVTFIDKKAILPEDN